MVSMAMPGSMNMKAPASATHSSRGSRVDLDELHLLAEDLVVDLVRLLARRGRGAVTRRRRGQPGWAP